MVKQVLDAIINTFEDYKNELADREDVKKLHPKYQQGVKDGIAICIQMLNIIRKQYGESKNE